MNALLESMTGLTLLDPWLFVLAALVPVALMLRYRRGRPATAFAPFELAKGLPRSWRARLLPVPRLLQVLALVLVAFALARPARRVQLPLEKQGIDILLCLDVSSSMAANDLDPVRTRLDVVKDAATRFVSDRPNDRIGLIRFARFPDVLCPLTLDHGALARFLGDLERVEADGAEDMTGIGTAVARAAQVLKGGIAKSKVVILLTDGEENVASTQSPDEIGPLQAAALCEQLGVRVYTIAAGIGKRSKTGDWIPLDTARMRRLAERTGGRFYEARDAAAVAGVYGKIDELETVEFAEPRYELADAFLPFLLLAVGLLLLGRVLGATAFEVLP